MVWQASYGDHRISIASPLRLKPDKSICKDGESRLPLIGSVPEASVDIIYRIKKEQRVIEKKIKSLEKEIKKLNKASGALRGVEKKARRRSAAKRRKIRVDAKRRGKKQKKAMPVPAS
jgi:hypothetical protein